MISLRLLLVMVMSFYGAQSFSSGGTKCSDWVSGPGITVVPSSSSNIGVDVVGGAIQIGLDHNNTKIQACRDASDPLRGAKGYPSIFERIKLMRLGDAFNPVYKVYHQTCMFRDIFCNHAECSISDFNFSTFQCGAPKDAWTNTTAIDPHAKNTYCLEKYLPTQKIKHDPTGKATNKSNLALVCAYVGGKAIDGSCLLPDYLNLIGCVDEPAKPAPPIYNPSIVTQAQPVIDYIAVNASDPASAPAASDVLQAYVARGSTFNAPVIQMVLANPVNNTTTYLPLYYSYSGVSSTSNISDGVYSTSSAFSSLNPNQANCGSFTSINTSKVAYTYCAQIPAYDPSQICACMKIITPNPSDSQDLCAVDSYIGCVPRPNVKQSGYAVVVDNISGIYNDSHYSSSNNSITPIPQAKISFVKTDGIGPIITDADGTRVMKSMQDRKYYKLDDHNNMTTVRAKAPVSTVSNNGSQGASIVSASAGISNNTDGSITVLKGIFEHRPNYDLSSPLVTNPYSITGYSQDVLTVFGVDFSAIMPVMNINNGQPLIETILTPGARRNVDGCNAYSAGSSLSSTQMSMFSNSLSNYYVPDGTRWRSSCRGRQAAVGATYNNSTYAGMSLGCFYNGNDGSSPNPALAANYFSMGNGYLDCQQTSVGIGCDMSGKNCAIQPGNFVLSLAGDANNGSLNCCMGAIPNDFNFLGGASTCSSVYTHDAYAEGIVCPGVYVTDVYNDISANNTGYGRPRSTDLTLMIQGNLSTPMQIATGLDGNNNPLLNSSLPSNIGAIIDPLTGVKQVSNICVYSSATGGWDPIGYNLNSTNDASDDPTQLNIYLCDHVPQMCNTITAAIATPSTANAVWDRAIDGATNTGTCLAGYTTNSGGTTVSGTCNDGAMIISPILDANGNNTNTCYTSCAAINSAVNGDWVNSGYATFSSSANGQEAFGTCIAGYTQVVVNGSSVPPTLTCRNGEWNYANLQNPCVLASCPAITSSSASSGWALFSPGSNGSTATGACDASSGYIASSNTPPTMACNNGSWGVVQNACVQGCQAFTPPTGTAFADTSAKTTGTVVTGGCDSSNNYFGTCTAAARASLITNAGQSCNASKCSGGCSSQQSDPVITATCGSNGQWTFSNNSSTCGKNNCNGFDNSTINYLNSKSSGWSGLLDCDSRHKNPPTVYCRNGAWSGIANGRGSDTCSLG